ncbi:MAG: hypothetical protein J5952_07890 [Prevotella sp.]|nr:hypothetical protein [Prevotella sp.]
MKKMKTIQKTWGLLLTMAAALALTACNSDDKTTEAPPAPSGQQGEVKTIPYSVTVGGDEAAMRATVDADLKTLRFAAGDQLYISAPGRDDVQAVLTLKAGGEGQTSAAFEGQLTYTGDAPGDDLTLEAVLVGADNQLYTISGGRVTDKTYPTTTFCKDVDEAVRQYSSLTGSATFASRSFTLTQGTAFLDFSITFSGGPSAGDVLSATYSRAGSAVCSSDVTAENDGGNVVARFVVPVEAGDHFDHSELAIDGGGRISFGGSAEIKPKVYRVARSSRIVNLQTIAEGFTAQDGDVLTGSATNKSISIAAGASVTLSDVTISDNSSAGLTCSGSATITLVGTNSVATTRNDYPAIQAGPSGTTLEIKGDGSLTATGGFYGAGIGSGAFGSCGNITISGGSVTATGRVDGAGIGSGAAGSCGNITISGGTVTATATGGVGGAGIGSGDSGSCGNITITGGSGTATAGSDCLFDIGPGVQSTCGTVSVASGTISGRWVLVECQFTVAYYLNSTVMGGIVYPSVQANNVTPATITVSIDGKTYSSAAISPEGGNMVTVTIFLPNCENKTLTITSPNTPYGNTTPQSTATFSGTLSGVTISPSGTNYLGTVNLIKQ